MRGAINGEHLNTAFLHMSVLCKAHSVCLCVNPNQTSKHKPFGWNSSMQSFRTRSCAGKSYCSVNLYRRIGFALWEQSLPQQTNRSCFFSILHFMVTLMLSSTDEAKGRNACCTCKWFPADLVWTDVKHGPPAMHQILKFELSLIILVPPQYFWVWPFLRSGDLLFVLLSSLLPFFFKASGQHHMPGVLIRWQVPECGSLAGLLRVVCVISGLCLRVAAGHGGNHSHPVYHTDRNSPFTLHHRWHGWVGTIVHWAGAFAHFANLLLFLIGVARVFGMYSESIHLLSVINAMVCVVTSCKNPIWAIQFQAPI